MTVLDSTIPDLRLAWHALGRWMRGVTSLERSAWLRIARPGRWPGSPARAVARATARGGTLGRPGALNPGRRRRAGGYAGWLSLRLPMPDAGWAMFAASSAVRCMKSPQARGVAASARVAPGMLHARCDQPHTRPLLIWNWTRIPLHQPET